MEIRKCFLIIGFIGIITACANFTEIDPKGKNILNRVEDLDLLLNSNYDVSCVTPAFLVNDIYPEFVNVPNLFTETIKTLDGVFATWDESADRAALTNSDDTYSALYGIIGKVANAVLLNVDAATGDPLKAKQVKAEALVLRAWCHYILVNLYAKAYTPATAATDPGIVYMLETYDLAVPHEKSTVAQVYEYILKDLDEAFALESLPENPASMRIGLAFAYAAKAKILMSMCDYEGAFSAAEECLKLNSVIDNYNDKLVLSESVKAEYNVDAYVLDRYYFTCEEEIWETPQQWHSARCLTYEFWEDLEENHIYQTALLTDTYLVTLNPSVPTNQAVYYCGLENLPCSHSSVAEYYSPIGLTTVDMYLVQAECCVRDGNTEDAMALINKIRENRLLTGTYSPVSATSAQEAFGWLKKVSRAENFSTFKNFINLKRWNTEEAYAETLYRSITVHVTGSAEEITYDYELRPDSPLWVFAFPQDATNFNPYLTQNY